MIHQTAIIDATAKIADDVEIGAYSIIGADVEIESGTWIGPHVVINGPTKIGKNNKIYQFSSIGEDPQDLKFSGENSSLEIGDENTIRENVTISRGTADGGGVTKVGSHNFIMAYVHIAHDCHIKDRVILANCVQLAGHVMVDDFAIIGGSTAVHQFVKIGAHVMVAGGSLVRKDVPPFVTAAREPLSYAGINSIGLRRRGFSNEKINEIQEIYRIIYLRGKNNSKALDNIQMEMSSSKERDEIVNFVRSSDRGVMKGYNNKI